MFDNIDKIKQAHPFPWASIHMGNGLYSVIDANRQQVNLIALMNFASIASNIIAKHEEQKCAPTS